MGLRVVDLFCGGGGFSEGFHMAGFDVVYGADFWKPACDTHALNGLGTTEKVDLLSYEVDDVLALKSRLEKGSRNIDVLIGSPPCTEFSYAKKGGRGDVEKGMLLVRKHLLFVSLFKPKYWLMENVPRLEEVLAKECEGSISTGWRIPYEKLGIPRSRFKELGLEKDSLSIPCGTVHLASDYGACENRKRFIVGEYPLEAMASFKIDKGSDISLGGLLERFEKGLKASNKSGKVEDPNYPGHFVKLKELRDNFYDTSVHPMNWEEMRHLKRRHIQYGRMDFPEDLTYPARTIMATYNSSSRESILLDTRRKIMYQRRKRPLFRQPTVREVACIQGFPLDFQLVADRLSDRYKLIGNAVPCQLSYALARAIREDIRSSFKKSDDESFKKRARSTILRADRAKGPILREPEAISGEAIDAKETHMEFGARADKHMRRKLLSSKLEMDSCVVVFDNGELVEGKLKGGVNWKAGLHRGVGSEFSKVYLDSVSIPRILQALSALLDADDLRGLVSHLLSEVDKGVPLVSEGWYEFPGYNGGLVAYKKKVGQKRMRIPSVTLFQKAFTSEMRDIGGVAGPIDFFDGLDAVMLLTFADGKFSQMRQRMVHMSKLKDEDTYANRIDPRMLHTIKNVNIPLVSLASGLMCVRVLLRMYEADDAVPGSVYQSSLKKADAAISQWVGRC
jgi:site-specific DNA-cytosine methylase